MSYGSRQYTVVNPDEANEHYTSRVLVVNPGQARPVTTLPSASDADTGVIYYRTTDGTYWITDGTTWYEFGGGSTATEVTMMTSSGNISITDDVVLIDASSAAVTATLPAASSCKGKKIDIVAVDITNTAAVAVQAGETLYYKRREWFHLRQPV